MNDYKHLGVKWLYYMHTYMNTGIYLLTGCNIVSSTLIENVLSPRGWEENTHVSQALPSSLLSAVRPPSPMITLDPYRVWNGILQKKHLL